MWHPVTREWQLDKQVKSLGSRSIFATATDLLRMGGPFPWIREIRLHGHQKSGRVLFCIVYNLVNCIPGEETRASVGIDSVTQLERAHFAGGYISKMT